MAVLSGAIAHGIYGEYGDACIDAKVNAYLRSGTLPTRDLTCQKLPSAG